MRGTQEFNTACRHAENVSKYGDKLMKDAATNVSWDLKFTCGLATLWSTYAECSCGCAC